MKLRVLQSLKRTLIALITMLGLFTVSNITAQTVEAKELTEVVTLLQHLDQSDGTVAPNASGGYDLRTGQAYKLRLVFDLKKYNGDLVDGDYFTFNFPAPMSIISNTTQLIDPKTGVNIGEVVITGNGANLGGTAKVTLKNLEAYRLATGEDIIKDISGNFATTFIFRTDQNKVVINYDSASLVDPVSYTYSAVTNTGTVEGYENFAKNGGVASKKAWTSARLQAIGSPSSGEFVSSWRLRINNGAQDLGQNLLITDYIPNDPQYASIQYIPESVKVYRIPIDQQIGTGPAGGTLLTENTDYTLQWNANYTRLEITLKDGSQKYFISYDTTTPNDGSKVANYISVTKEDGTKVTQRSNNTRTDMTAAATSLYSGTIVASTAYMIKINKVDEFSMAPLQGAVFTVTAADGSVAPQEITTDSNGAALTLAYNPSMVGKTFIIKEKTAPTGYQLDPTEYRVVLGSGGSVLNLKNTPVHALVDVTARKELSGRTLLDQEFTFKLYDANGNEVGEAKNDATGAIVFSGVKLSGTGTYQYSIGEVDTQNGGVTFDLERKYVTIEVIRGADGMLKATVTSQPVVFTNSYTVSPAKVSVTAQKNLTGRDLKDREFSFELYDAAGGLVATGHNDTNGLITFPDFTLDTVGTYTFTMKEVVGTLGGMTYDTTEYPVTVEVSDNQQGQLVATVTSPSPIFTNHYKAAAASVTLSATKTLIGRTLKANEFEFVLTNQDGQEVGRVTNTENGAVTFAPITITEAGTYTYTISEVKGNLGGVTYDDSTVKATVVVTDNEEGALEAAVTYENNDQTFENTYSASPVKVKIPAVKRLDGRDLKAEEFEFQLKDDATQTVVEAVKNTADGQINFTELTFNTVGEYTYTISEVQGNLGGVQYDTTDVKATISVTDNGYGQLQAALAFEDGDNGFENSYSAAPGAATLSANKVLHGRDLKADEFEFVLKNQDGQEVERVKNLANGDVNFSALTFTKEGTYTYTISEVQGNLGGVLYDGTDVKATVTVTDNGQGQLVTSIVYENDDQTFENSYSASQTSVQLTAKKVLEGRELNADEFEFVLSAENGPEIETVKNAADGSITFASITYTQAGTYTYTISEKEAGLEGITYDKTTAKVTVEVVDNGQGQLVATVISAVPTFKNIYVEPITTTTTTTTTTTIPTTSTTVTTTEVTTTETTSVEPTVTTTDSTSADTTVTSEATTSKSTTEEPSTTVAMTSTVTTTEEPPVSTTEMTSESTEGSTTVSSESSTTDVRTSEGTTTSASTTSGDSTTVATTSEESTTSAVTTTLPVSTATTTAEPTTTTDDPSTQADPATTTGTTTGGRTTADGQTPPANGGNPPSKQVLPSTGESTSLGMFIGSLSTVVGR